MIGKDVRSSTFTFALLSTLSWMAHASIASNWTNPSAHLPSFSSTYLVGERILLSWQPLNESAHDLWLTRYDSSTDDFALRIASMVNVGTVGSFPWQIAIAEEEVLVDTRFEFAFVPGGVSYDATAVSNIVSPGFNLMMVNQATPPNGTAGSSTSEVATSTAGSGTSRVSSASSTAVVSPTPDASNDDEKIHPALTGGITVAVLVAVALAGFGIGYWFFRKRQSRHKAKTTTENSEVTLSGPYEILGDRWHPVETSGKEMQVHEMKSSRNTIVAESAGASVHEVGNTVKRPGLHEMAG